MATYTRQDGSFASTLAPSLLNQKVHYLLPVLNSLSFCENFLQAALSSFNIMPHSIFVCSKHNHMKDHVIHHLFCMFGHLVVTTHVYCHSNTQPGSALMCIGNPSPAKAMFTIETGGVCQVSYPIRQCVTPERYSSCYTPHNLPMSSLTLSQGIHTHATVGLPLHSNPAYSTELQGTHHEAIKSSKCLTRCSQKRGYNFVKPDMSFLSTTLPTYS